jgi:hypothetical protein
MDTVATTAPSPESIGSAGTPPYRLRWVVAAVVLATAVMDLLDATIVNLAAPSIHRELGGGASTIQWLSAGYTLSFAVLLIAGARLGDILGRRRLFLAAAPVVNCNCRSWSRAAGRTRRATSPDSSSACGSDAKARPSATWAI